MKIVIGVETAPRIQFIIDADPDNMPDIITIKNRTLRLVGKYASPGMNFSYRDINGTWNHDGELKDWIQYQPLTG